MTGAPAPVGGRRKILSAQGRSGTRSNTTRWPASAAQRSIVAARLLRALGDGPLQIRAQHLALHHEAPLAPALRPHDQQVGAPAPECVLALDAPAAVYDALQVRESRPARLRSADPAAPVAPRSCRSAAARAARSTSCRGSSRAPRPDRFAPTAGCGSGPRPPRDFGVELAHGHDGRTVQRCIVAEHSAAVIRASGSKGLSPAWRAVAALTAAQPGVEQVPYRVTEHVETVDHDGQATRLNPSGDAVR